MDGQYHTIFNLTNKQESHQNPVKDVPLTSIMNDMEFNVGSQQKDSSKQNVTVSKAIGKPLEDDGNYGNIKKGEGILHIDNLFIVFIVVLSMFFLVMVIILACCFYIKYQNVSLYFKIREKLRKSKMQITNEFELPCVS